MADEVEYPLPSFHFSVSIEGGEAMAFSEVSGLEMENEVIEYNHGLSKNFTSMKMPGQRKYSSITLKRGTTAGDNTFYEWITTNLNNVAERKTVTISLLDEEHNPKVTWNLDKAWPSKVTYPDMNAGNNDVAVESMELAHEGLAVEHN